ncbi:hypothetical protein HDU86_006202 [Geranomyces michiganensis]|nr:hypothetical protein HDU86_006202 [Geranomyces michiganensis]
MSALLRTTARIALTASPLRAAAPVRAMSVRAAGGKFAEREKGEEDRYTWEHEKEQIKALRAQLAAKENAAKKKLDAKEVHDPEFHEELKQVNPVANATHAGGSDSISKREAAAENRYIREMEAKNKKH